ncbi:MAG: NADH-quinone oxidoreductase subunit A [Myxococcaceae bacterium]
MVLWPFVVYFVAVLALLGVMLGLSAVLGERHSQPATGLPYEGGIVSAGTAQVRFGAQFYVLAMLFVVFDVEAVFIVAWAVAGRELGWAGYAAMVVFVAVLGAALAYLWRVGALDYRPRRAEARE